jgi:hypothetical protein
MTGCGPAIRMSGMTSEFRCERALPRELQARLDDLLRAARQEEAGWSPNDVPADGLQSGSLNGGASFASTPS